MCEATEGDRTNAVVVDEDRNGRHAQHHRTRNLPQSPLDTPNAVAGRSLVERTAQHLATLALENGATTTWSTSPLIVQDTILMLATTTGSICLWNAQDMLASTTSSSMNNDSNNDNSNFEDPTLFDIPHRPVAPICIVETTAKSSEDVSSNGLEADTSAAIVQLFEVPIGTGVLPIDRAIAASSPSKKNAASSDTADTAPVRAEIVAASNAGDVHILSIDSTEPWLCHVAFSWNTKCCGITSATVMSNGNIVVGYQSGVLEAWAVQPEKPRGLALQRSLRRNRSSHHWVAELVWRGVFESQYPVQAMAPLRPRATTSSSVDVKQGLDAASPNTTARARNNECLVLTVQPDTHCPTMSLLEVVSAASIANAWEHAQTKNESSSSFAAVRLEEHWILPQAGMELVDASTLLTPNEMGLAVPTRPDWVPTRGTGSLCTLPDMPGSCASVAIGLADGTVGILSATIDEDKLSWGIQREADQLVLSYPSVGLGNVITVPCDSDDTNESEPHLACCLRGGTVYLVTIRQETKKEAPDDNDSRPLTVLSYPHDIDSDVPIVHHVQGFTAGNLRLPKNRKTVPVVVYAWPGGIVDLFGCELHKPDTERCLLEELIATGTVESAMNLLLSSSGNGNDKEPILSTPEWTAARTEVMAVTKEPDQAPKLTTDDLYSDELTSFRSLLLSFAEISQGALVDNAH